MPTKSPSSSPSSWLFAIGAGLALLAPGCALPSEESSDDTGGADATTGDTGPSDGSVGETGADTAADTGSDGDPDSGSSDTGPPPVDLVPVTIDTQVLLPTNHGDQLYTLFSAEFTAGSAMGRMRVWARFCADTACEEPVAVVPGVIEDADEDGYYVFSTASPSGMGFDHAVRFEQAPVGTWTMQLIGDTEASHIMDKGECSGLDDCPGDVDLLQMDGTSVEPNVEGGREHNPVAATMEITIDAEGDAITVPDVVFLGHVVFAGDEIHTPPPVDDGRLLVAVSGEADDFRNFMALVDLDGAEGSDAPAADSYVLQHDGADFLGDVCGVVSGGGSRYAIGVGSDGAHVFALDADGQQVSDTPIVSMPPVGEAYPWPCRGVYAEIGGHEHLYLVQFQGAGSLDNSDPHPLYDVDLTDGTVGTPLDGLVDMALRSVAIDAANNLVAMDMSWSEDAGNAGQPFDRLVPITLDGTGAVTGTGTVVVTDHTSNQQCDSTANWPSSVRVVEVGGTERLLLGHDDGVAVLDPATLTEVDDLDLRDWGTLFAQMAPSPDGSRIYALPTCKSTTAEDFELPQGADVERADKNLVAVLDATGSDLALADTGIDVNGDGTHDEGIDLDYYRVKSYIRSFSTTLPIPPVVYVGPQVAVGESMLFVRGSGIQGNGGATISSSGMGQPQDFAMFDLGTGHGVVLGGYMPFFDGLSAMAGTGAAIWGWDVWPGRESSVGWIEYLPAQ